MDNFISDTVVSELVVLGVKAQLQMFWFVNNLGK